MSNLGALDMALDDVISQNRTNNKRPNNNSNSRRGNPRTTGGGINKNRSSGVRSSPYNGARPARNNNNSSRPSRPVDSRINNTSNRMSNSLVVANLHFNVTEKDLYDLFGQIGQLKRAFLHIGPNGKSAGIADVVFANASDAEKARNTYNNVELDGRPMRITSASIISAVTAAPLNSGRRGNIRGGNTNGRDTNGRDNNRRDNNSRGGRSGGGRREARPKPSQQDLDAEMDTYMGSANNEDIQMN
ncbi:hypothetical protein MFLAVUS_010962 [Mucor flavus]|uniref:RRM domain-containing protein n=1 Tax=Mucor flavus TaxID=439312 RepID=A0ABP9ZEA7_9FUNG